MSHERGERERAELGPQGLLIFLYMQFAVSSSTLSNRTVVLLHQKALGSTCSCAYMTTSTTSGSERKVLISVESFFFSPYEVEEPKKWAFF